MSEEIITETNRETATDHEYGGAQIQVLEGLEAVRKRPGMYIGSTGPSGLHHLVYEIVDNSIDEALAGYCTHIEVTIKPGNIIEVSDNGRGIPVDIQPKLGIPAVTVVYTVLHAGGKFGGEDSGYKVAGGLHGVGASVVNALSEWLVVHVRRDGAEYEQSFKRGKPDGDLKKIGVAASTGTTVTFKPDPEMFTETTEYDYEILLKRLREESFLNAGVRITLTDERPESIEKNDGVPPQESMCYEGGVRISLCVLFPYGHAPAFLPSELLYSFVCLCACRKLCCIFLYYLLQPCPGRKARPARQKALFSHSYPAEEEMRSHAGAWAYTADLPEAPL